MEVLKSTIQDMEKERDFYFGKLRNIELICQEKENEEDPTLNRIIDILYATDVSSAAAALGLVSHSQRGTRLYLAAAQLIAPKAPDDLTGAGRQPSSSGYVFTLFF